MIKLCGNAFYSATLLWLIFSLGRPLVYAKSQLPLAFHEFGLAEQAKVFEYTYSSVKDKNGYYWFGTAHGLYRYDGKNAVNIHSLQQNIRFDKPVTHLRIHNNVLWAGTTNGLYKLDLKTYQLSVLPQLQKSFITQLSVDSNNSVWVMTLEQGVFHFIAKGNQYLIDEGVSRSQRAFKLNRGRSIITIPNGGTWIATDQGIVLYDPVANAMRYAYEDPVLSKKIGPLAGQKISELLRRKTGEIVISTLNYVYEFSSRYELLNKTLLPCAATPKCTFKQLSETQNGDIFGLLQPHSILRLSRYSHDTNTYEFSEQNQPILNLSLTDDNQLISVGTKVLASLVEHRAYYPHVTALAEHNTTLSNFTAKLYLQGNDGDLWMANGKHLVRYNMHDHKLSSYISPVSIYKFVVDKNGAVWIISSETSQLFRFDTSTQTIGKPIRGSVANIAYSKRDGIWLIHDEFTLSKLNVDTFNGISYSNNVCLDALSTVLPSIVDDQRLAWISDGELCRYNPKLDRFDRIAITGISRDSNSDGLLFTNNKYWKLKFPTIVIDVNPVVDSEPLRSRVINTYANFEPGSRFVVDNEFIWGINSKQTQLYRFNTNTELFDYYSLSEGVPEHSDSKIIGMNKQHQLLLSTPGKITTLDTRQLALLPVDQRLKVHSASILQEYGGSRTVYKVTDEIQLSNTDYSVELEFGTTRPRIRDREFTYYRLKNHNDNWLQTKRGFVRYSGLAPGQYVFQLKIRPDSPDSVDLALFVEAPLWLRWWAYLLYGILSFAALGSVIWLRIQHHRQLTYMANNDSLTGLANRYSMIKHLKILEDSQTPFALFFIDLDRFKSINDSLGHQIGDKLLIQVAQKFTLCLTRDMHIARLGGDEFIVVVTGANIDTTANRCVEKLINTLRKPIELDYYSLHIGMSIGIAQYPKDSADIQVLLSYADVAMYHSKSQGSNIHTWYTPELGKGSLNALVLESELYQGLQNNEFIPYYQQKTDMRTGKPIGYEALARWIRSTAIVSHPEEFIEIAERTGDIFEISWALLHQVCAQLSLLQQQNIALPIAVNVSAKQLAHNNFAAKFTEIVDSHAIDPCLIQLEVTESMLLNNKENSIWQLKLLKQRGHKIFIDDFGTGYSSFAYLKQLPIDAIKIDQSFVLDILREDNSQNIVKSIIYLAQSLQLDLVAEGVEDLETANYLMSLGCNVCQGYYYSKPMRTPML